MEQSQSSYLPERNPVTHRIHRREVLWQVTLPLVVGILVILALAVWATFGSDGTVSTWADISLIWLIIPVFFAGLVLFAVLAGFVYALIWLIRKVPVWMRKLQDLVYTVGSVIRSIDDKIVEPILRIQSFTAKGRTVRRHLRQEPPLQR